MKKVNNKKLNNKGFTLIELLAVIVILALVMGIAATSMLTTMNNSRKSTLHSAAQTAAANLNNWVVEDQLATTANDQRVGNDFVTNTQGTNANTWICLNDARINQITNKGSQTSLVKALQLNENDIVISTNAPSLSDGTYTITSNNSTVTDNTCSALRYNSSTGAYEFLLVARNGGKYYVASETNNYAFSRAANSNVSLVD